MQLYSLEGEEDLGYAQIIAAAMPVIKKVTKTSNKIGKTVLGKLAERIKERRNPKKTQPNLIPQQPVQQQSTAISTPVLIGGALGVILIAAMLKGK